MKKSVISKMKVLHVIAICFCALLANICSAADIELPCNVQITGSLTAGSFAGDGAGLNNVSPIYENTVIVSAAGTASENGTVLLDALDGITDASADNPYLLKLEPGIYDIGSAILQMKEHVDIEGSGQISTKITGDIDSSSAGVVMGASNTELRFIKVENTSVGTDGIGIYNLSSSPRMTNVTATASGAASFKWGICNDSSSPTMTNITATASGAAISNNGIRNHSSSPTMMNITANASGACAGNDAISNYFSSPTMTNVTAIASGAVEGNCGIFNYSSSPSMTNVTATASGAADYNRGIYNDSSSSTMTNVIATASGATVTDYGVYNRSSSSTMTNVTAEGDAAGIRNYAPSGTYEIHADHCIFTSGTTAIDNDTEFTFYIGASKLDGGADSDGTYNCVHCYDGGYAALESDCQPPSQ